MFYKQFSSQFNTWALCWASQSPAREQPMQDNCRTLTFSSSTTGGRQARWLQPALGDFMRLNIPPRGSVQGHKWPRPKAGETKASNSSSWPVEMPVDSKSKGWKASSALLIMGDWDRTITGHQPRNVTLSALSFFLKLLLTLLMLCSFPKRREEKRICCRGFIWKLPAKPVSLWAHPGA